MLQVFFEMAKLPNRQASGKRNIFFWPVQVVLYIPFLMLLLVAVGLLLVQSFGRIPVIITGMPREIPRAQ
jgi:hypothetical protein